MSGRWLVAGALLLGAAIAVACGGGDDEDGDRANPSGTDGGGEASAGDGSASDAAPPACPLPETMRSEVRGRVTILDGSSTTAPAAGARVCIHGRADLPCVDALADGTYEHTCVPTGNAGILFSHETGRVLWLRVLVAGFPQSLNTPIATRAENVKLFEPAGVAYPQAGMGIVNVNDSLDSANGGVTVTGPAGSIGPFYSADGAKVTSDAGPTSGAGHAFLLVPAGDARIGLAGANGGCAQLSGGWDSVDGGITVPVIEDVETRVLVTCP